MTFRLAPLLLLCVWIGACSSSSTHAGTDAAASQDAATGTKDGASSKDGGNPKDSSSSKDSVASNDGRSAECNALTTAGAPYSPLVLSSQPVPAAEGGTVSDGTYVLTSQVLYTSHGTGDASALGTLAEKISVSGSTWQAALSYQYAGGPVTGADGGLLWTLEGGTSASTATLTFAAKGGSFTLTQTCGTGSLSQSGTYTATPTEIVLIDTTSSLSGAVTFTKQ
jgi:hypothetical protein